MQSLGLQHSNIYPLKSIKTTSTILIAHNNISVIRQYQSLFESLFNIEIATCGHSALNKLSKQNIDLAILNVELPGLSGFSVLKRFNTHTPFNSTSFIFMSEATNIDQEKTALALGAIDYINTSGHTQITFNRVKNSMELIEQNKQLALSSNVDALTGLANRKMLDDSINDEFEKSVRGDYALTLMMIDIDDFKLFNDEFGHLEGDKCLTQVAQTLKLFEQRNSDLAARFGGEEFTLVLPYTNSDGAKQLANKIIEKIQALKIRQSKLATHEFVSISIGIATHNNGIHFNHPEKMIEDADSKLYQAKSLGKNRFVD